MIFLGCNLIDFLEAVYAKFQKPAYLWNTILQNFIRITDKIEKTNLDGVSQVTFLVHDVKLKTNKEKGNLKFLKLIYSLCTHEKNFTFYNPSIIHSPMCTHLSMLPTRVSSLTHTLSPL